MSAPRAHAPTRLAASQLLGRGGARAKAPVPKGVGEGGSAESGTEAQADPAVASEASRSKHPEHLERRCSRDLGESGRTQTTCSSTGDAVQHQEWDGKESPFAGKLEDGKLVVECVANNVTCTGSTKKWSQHSLILPDRN